MNFKLKAGIAVCFGAGSHGAAKLQSRSTRFWEPADNEKDSIGSAPAEGWRGATECPGRSASDRIH